MVQQARRPANAVITCLLWAVLLMPGGCAFSRGELGTAVKAEDIAAIKKGQTTEAQVVALLGAPDDIREIGRRELFHYYRYVLKHATVVVFSRANIASDQVYVLFDERGVVEDVITGDRTDQLKFQFWPFGE
jgi:outer membrane protein assembly factor BamE (lipoprotein component of BamABCDE complex)